MERDRAPNTVEQDTSDYRPRRTSQEDSESPAPSSVPLGQPRSVPGLVMGTERAGRGFGPLRAAMLLGLQQTVGNRAAGEMLRRAQARAAEGAVVGPEGGPLESHLAGQIEAKRGHGVPLDPDVRGAMEGALGARFADVGIHTDAEADALNRSVGARAFTVGTDIFLSQGADRLGSAPGNRLLAHELTHVIQQRSMSGSGPMTVGPADDTLEQDAAASAFALEGVASGSVDTATGQRWQAGQGQGTDDGAEGRGGSELARASSAGSRQSVAAGSLVMRDTLQSQVPAEVDLSRASVSFTIPKGKDLDDKVYTTDQTSVSLSVTRTGIHLSLSPALHIQALPGWVVLLSPLVYFGVSDAEWSGLDYGFASASVTSVSLADTGVGFSIQGQARSAITSLVNGLFAGTPVATAGYDPMTDPDLMGTMAAIQANATRSSSGGGVLGTDVSNLEFAVSASFHAVHIEEKGEGIDIPGGTNATLRVRMDGTLADVADPAKRKIRVIEIETGGIKLLHGGSPVATIRRVYINYGGSVTVGDFTAEGGLGVLEGLFAIGGLVAGAGETPSNPELGGAAGMVQGAESVHRWGRGQIEAALTPEVQQLIRAHRAAIPGADLATMLGL